MDGYVCIFDHQKECPVKTEYKLRPESLVEFCKVCRLWLPTDFVELEKLKVEREIRLKELQVKSELEKMQRELEARNLELKAELDKMQLELEARKLEARKLVAEQK